MVDTGLSLRAVFLTSARGEVSITDQYWVDAFTCCSAKSSAVLRAESHIQTLRDAGELPAPGTTVSIVIAEGAAPSSDTDLVRSEAGSLEALLSITAVRCLGTGST